MRVFVFDDNDRMRELIEEILEDRDCEVHAFKDPSLCPVYTGGECGCSDGHVCTDVVITDFHMPVMNGLEFVTALAKKHCRVDPRNRAIISGMWRDDDRARAEKLGCRTFRKPFDFNELNSWLDECERRVQTDRRLIRPEDCKDPWWLNPVGSADPAGQ